jgi:hypothetical protein
VRESAASMKENYKSFHQEEGIIVVQNINNLFEEALGFRVSSEHGGGHGTAEEERHSSPRWHEGHTKLVYEVHGTSMTYEGAARPTSLLTHDHLLHLHTLRGIPIGLSSRWRRRRKKLAHLK